MANQAAFGPIVQAAAGTLHVINAVAGQKYRLMGMYGTMTVTGIMQIKSSGGAAMSGPVNLIGGQPFNIDAMVAEGGEAWAETQPGEGMDIVTTTGGFNGGFTGEWMPA